MSTQLPTVERPGSRVEGQQAKPLVIVKYHALQEGFATLAPRALYNVVGGDVPELLNSTVTIEALFVKGYAVREEKAFRQGNVRQGNPDLSHSVAVHSSASTSEAA